LASTLGHQLAPSEGTYTVYSNVNPEIRRLYSTSLFCYPELPITDGVTNIRVNLDNLKENLTPAELNICDSLTVTLSECVEIQRDTVKQRDSPRWDHERQHRITSSKFGNILLRKSAPTNSFLKSLDGKISSHIPAISYGISHEATAVGKYITYMQNMGHPIVVEEVGLVVNPDIFWLGASPDRKVIDLSEKEPYGILEVKCPYSQRDRSLEEACKDQSFYMEKGENGMKLKRNSQYWYQVQGQLGITGASWVDFVVYPSKSFALERIQFDSECWKYMLSSLTNFYFREITSLLR
jgi:hypothetical protein